MISSKKKKNTKMDIPNDLINEIFLRLSPQSLLRIRWVCKSWFNLIRDPSFVNMQLYNNNISHKPNNNNPLVLIYTHNDNQHNLKLNSYNIIMDSSSIDDDYNTCPHSLVSVKGPSVKIDWHSFKILGSCNGLLCIGVGTCVRETYFIWNPCTNEYKKASDHRNDLCCGNPYGYDCYSRYGFGYDRTIDDYKLVKTTTALLCQYNGDRCKTCVYVYTLGTNRWKTVVSTYQFLLCRTDKEANGLFISGHLYYTAMRTSWSKTFDIIVSFDIAKEEYIQIPIPDKVGISNPVMNLGELKGCLCLLCSTILLKGHWEVWMMRHNVENNMDVKERYTWEKLYTVGSVHRSWSYNFITKLLRFCKNGELLMVLENRSINWKKIVLCDPKSGNITVLHEVDFAASVENYIESLVSLNSDTYMS